MTDSPVKRTIQSYDNLVTSYLARWQDRSIMNRQFDRFVNLLPISNRSKPLVADIGCGPGFDAAVLRDRGLRVVCLDLSWAMLLAGQRAFPGSFVQADMRHLPLASLFDGLWVNAALLHLPREDVPAALAGFAAVLRPGGCLFLSIRQGRGEAWQQKAYGRSEPRFFTYWHPDDFDALLNRAGLTILSAASERQNEITWINRFARK